MSKRYKRMQPRAQKANPAYSGLTMMSDIPQPQSMPRNYKAYAREGYGSNDTLFKVVNYGITNGAAIPPILFKDRSMKSGRIEKHPLLDKLNRPNNEQSGVFYRKAILGYYLIAGNSYQYVNRIAQSGPPDELWTLQPDKVEPMVDKTRGVMGYQYMDFPPEKNPIPAQLIGHMRTWNPEDPIFGMSAVQLAAIMIDQQTAARKWNLALLQNFLKPPGAWTTSAILSPNERAKVEERINARMNGYSNAGKAPLLDGSLKFEPSAVNPSEMDWQGSMKYNAGSIANLFNMAPQLIGDTSASTYNNMSEAEAASYTEYIFPMLDELYDLWNMWLVPMYPDLCDKNGNPTVYLYYDKESVEAVQATIQARLTAASQRGNTAFMQGVAMLDEARAMQGLPPLPQGSGQVFRYGAVLVPSNKVAEYAEQTLMASQPIEIPQDPGTLPGQPDDDEKLDTLLPVSKSWHRQIKALDLSTTEEKQEYASSMEATRKRMEDTHAKKIAAYFDQERKQVAKTIKATASTDDIEDRVKHVIDQESDDLKDILMGLYKDVAVDVGGQVNAALSGKKGVIQTFLSLFGESQLKYLLLLAGEKIKQITTTTLASVRLNLTEGVANGESIPELAKRIDALYLDQIIPNRSTVIARTEVVASSNYASHEAASKSDLTLKKVFLATHDDRTRPHHADADGQEVDLDEPFIVGGYKMMYPGDSSMGAPADEIIECRCTQFYKRVQSEEKHIIRPIEIKRSRRDEYRKFIEEVL